MTPPTHPAAALLARLRLHRLTLLLAAIALSGAGLILARQATYGVAIGQDSLLYASVARNLLAGDGFYLYNGKPLIVWPPFYPFLLAAASLGMFDPLAVAGPLNAAIFGLTIFIVGQYLRRRLQSRFLAVWGCLAVALSMPLIDAAAWALAGSLFILMTTLALIWSDNFLDNDRTWSLIWAAVFCALAWQTRYIGVAAPAAVGLLLLFQRGVSWPRKTRNIAVFSLLAAAPMLLWLLRRYLHTGRLSAGIPGVAEPLPEILGDIAAVLGGWAYSDLGIVRWPSLGVLLLAAATLAMAGYFSIIKQWRNRPRTGWRPGIVFGIFAIVYLALLIVALQQGNTFGGVRARYIAPIYIPIIIIAAVAIDRFTCAGRAEKPLGGVSRLPVIRTLVKGNVGISGPITVAMAITLSLWAALQIVPNAALIQRANSAELYLGYSDPSWAGSETLRYIRENPISGVIYSNEPPLVYTHNAGDARYFLMLNTWPRGNRDYVANALPLSKPARQDGSYVIWFSNKWNVIKYDYGDADLRVAPGLEPVVELSDGAIYRVNRDYAPAGNPYVSAYQAINSGAYGQPASRSIFDIYLNGGSMIYIKEPCYINEIREQFLLNIIPADANDLPERRRRWGSDNLDFSFPQHGLHFNNLCLAIMPLPNYEIARFTTGQHTREQGDLWLVEQDYVPPSSPYQTAYDAIASGEYGEPETRAAFDLYRNGNELIYLKEPCIAADTESLFFLHLYPDDAADLPAHREYDFDALDFLLPQRGARWDGKCLAIAPLPNYEIARIRTGQYRVGGEQIWKAEQYIINGSPVWRVQPADVSPDSPYQLAYDAIISGGYGEPETQAIFDIYRNGSELIYLKEPCAAADTEALFYLHLYPSDTSNLPEPRRQYGFDALDFPFPQHGVQWAGKCLAIVPLPSYQIARIRTGQYIVGGEQIWKAEQYIIDGRPVWRVQQDDLPPSSPYQSAYDAIASGDYGPPATGGAFDVYRNGNQLVYLKEPCAAADTEARFYLHVYPADVANLPAQRRPYGFDNPDFQFPQHGVRWSGKCLALAPLPGYEIARIRTGQYIIGGDRLWTAEFPPAANLTPVPAR